MENSSIHRAQYRAMDRSSSSEADEVDYSETNARMTHRANVRAIDGILQSDKMRATIRALAKLKMTGQQLVEYLKQPHVRKRIRNALLTAVVAGGVSYLVIMFAGFGSAGVTAGSLAASIQSVFYGASVPAGSWFASLTSMGALGTLSASFAIPAALTVGVAAAAIPAVKAAGAAAINKKKHIVKHIVK